MGVFISVEGTSILIGYTLNDNVLIELIKAKHLDMVDTIQAIPYIHSEYTAVLIEASKDNG